MARIRTIKPEFPQSETVGKLSREARLLFVLLWTICDDSGRTRAASRMLASLLYPYDDDARALIPEWLIELDQAGLIRVYEVEGNSYLDIPKWLTHQKIDRPSASKFPSFDEASRAIVEPSRKIAQDQGREGTKDQGPGGEAESEAPAAAVPALVTREVQAFDAWNRFARTHGAPTADFMTTTRRWRLTAILVICGGLAGWDAALAKTLEANFIRDRGGGFQRWFNLDWLLDEQKFTRLMEGLYAERHDAAATGIGANLKALAELR